MMREQLAHEVLDKLITWLSEFIFLPAVLSVVALFLFPFYLFFAHSSSHAPVSLCFPLSPLLS